MKENKTVLFNFSLYFSSSWKKTYMNRNICYNFSFVHIFSSTFWKRPLVWFWPKQMSVWIWKILYYWSWCALMGVIGILSQTLQVSGIVTFSVQRYNIAGQALWPDIKKSPSNIKARSDLTHFSGKLLLLISLRKKKAPNKQYPVQCK